MTRVSKESKRMPSLKNDVNMQNGQLVESDKQERSDGIHLKIKARLEKNEDANRPEEEAKVVCSLCKCTAA